WSAPGSSCRRAPPPGPTRRRWWSCRRRPSRRRRGCGARRADGRDSCSCGNLITLTKKCQQWLDEAMIHRFSVEVGGQERELTVEPLEGGRFAVAHAGRTRIIEARRVAGNERASSWSILPEGGGAAVLIDV